jgi:eukaryotic-like serine/threonine-protein kinase
MARLGDPARWPRLSARLDEALDLDVDERAAWLERLAASEPDLAGEIEALLVDHEASMDAGFLAGTAAVQAAEPDLAASLAGQTLGNYRLERPIGEGGMGSVWLAHRSDGRYAGKVAIKLLNASLIGQRGGERFKREGAILARLAHPNIARLIDAGVTGSGQPFLVLEYVEGERIDFFCDGARLDVPARLRLLLDVVAAVAHSHANLIVHRDIKPMNVLVATGGLVKLLDFGIAKLLEDGALASGANELTRAGDRVLTPEYAAPEQLLNQPVTTATDVYALGLLFYLLLGGQHPVAPSVRSTAELVETVIDTPAPRLSDAVCSPRTLPREALVVNAASRSTTPERLQRLLRGDLDNIVAKALKKVPGERYATVSAFADDIRRYLDHQPISARPDSIAYRTAKFVRRNRVPVAAGAVAALAVVAGLLGTITQAQRAAQEAREAQHERDRAVHELSYAEATDEFLGFLLQEGAQKPFTTAQLLVRGEQLIDRQFAGDPGLRARLLLTLANLYIDAMEPDKAEALLLRAQDAAKGAADRPLQAQIDCSLAAQFGDTSAFDRAIPLFASAIARLKAEPELDLGALAQCLTDRSMVSMLRGDADAALADAKLALASLGLPRPGQRSLAVTAYSALADARSMRGEMALAITEYQRAIDMLGAMGRGRTSQAVALLNGLGLRLSKAGQTLRAAAAYQQGLAIAREIENADNVGPGIETNYGKLLVDLGRPREAMPLFESALASATERGHARSIGQVSLLSAPAWCAENDFARCESLLALARVQMQTTVPPGHTMFGTLEMEEAQLALARHEWAAARRHLLQALSIFDAGKEWNPNRLRTLTLLARTELQLGGNTAAAGYAAQAVARARAALGGFAQSAWLGEALLAQAEIQTAAGDKAAPTTLGEALTQLRETMGEDAPATRQAKTLLARL